MKKVRKFGRDKEREPSWSVSELGAFYIENRNSFVNYANRFLRNTGTSEELVQDALIKVILASPELSNAAHAHSYVKKTIENLALDYLRKEGRRPQLVLIDEITAESEKQLQSQVDYSEIVASADDAAVVRQALSLLSSAERAALVMWEVEGRSAKDIARELGIKESSVRHTVSRARTSLRKILAELIIDEDRGLTALDLLSTNYKKGVKFAKSISKVSLSLFLILFGFIGYANVSNTLTNTPSAKSNPISLSDPSKTLENSEKVNSTENSTKQEKKSIIPQGSTLKNENAKAAPLIFSGLDKLGIPTGFSITDSSGNLGTLYFSRKEVMVTESGLTIPSLVKTSNGAANILMSQAINQDASGLSFVATMAYGREGSWKPVVSRVISTEVERLITGNYLLTVVIQVKSEVESVILIPASADGRDLEAPPTRVVTRILMDASKTQILAQAVLVVEKVPK